MMERKICSVFLCALIDFYFCSHREDVLVPSPGQRRGAQQRAFAQERSRPNEERSRILHRLEAPLAYYTSTARDKSH